MHSTHTCDEAFERVEKIAKDLKSGAILGSTEAAFVVFREIREASTACGKLFSKYLLQALPSFIEARPTSIIMKNLIRNYLEELIKEASEHGFDEARGRTPEIIDSILGDVTKVQEAVARVGAKRVTDDGTILIHSYSSTVLKLLEIAKESGKRFKVFVTESRPIGEGKVAASRLGALGIDTTLIVDSAVRYIMKKISDVFFSADAVAANGAVVNKIGTSAIALAAKEARVRTYVAAGTYKFGLETVFGELVEGMVLSDARLIIPPEKVNELAGRVLVRAPLFDVTPPEYVDAIITEIGVIAPQAIPLVIKEIYGWPPKVVSLDSLLEEVRKHAS